MFPLSGIISIYRTILSNRKSDEWYEFNRTVIKWAQECNDYKIALEILEYQSNLIRIDHLNIPKECKNIPKYKKEIYDRWGSYIPELKSQIREDKINSILK